MGHGERLVLTSIVTMLGEESCKDCRRKQKEGSGLWETAAQTAESAEDQRAEGEGRQRCDRQSFLGPRGHCEEFAIAHKC